jgi:hypothetical protein
MKDKARLPRVKDNKDRRVSAKVKKPDELPSELTRKSDSSDFLSAEEWAAEIRARRGAYWKDTALWRAEIEKGAKEAWASENCIWMDETDIMAALIEEVDARREAEEAKKNEK